MQLLFCCASSKPEPKLPAGDFHGGVGRRDASFGPSVRLLRWLKGFLLCFTHVKLKATLHSHYITLVHPLEYIWLFGVYGGTSSCSLRNDQNYPLPFLPFLSTRLLVSRVSSPLRSRILEDIEFGGWMENDDTLFTTFDLCEGKVVEASGGFVVVSSMIKCKI